jgi:phosphatidylglycerol---prolipoprotein diacylglyceryl transferase
VYCFGRFWVELLRIDAAHEFAGLRLNAWVAAIGFVLGIVWFVASQRGLRRRRRPEPGKGAPTMAVPKSRVRPGR